MTPEYLTALKESIVAWQQRAAGIENYDPCPLCEVGRKIKGSRSSVTICDECPVKEKTGIHSCHQTPYYAWANADSGSLTEAEDAREELEFLQSLLPQEDTCPTKKN